MTQREKFERFFCGHEDMSYWKVYKCVGFCTTFQFHEESSNLFVLSATIDNSLNGEGLIKYPNGNIYKGNFINGLPSGDGVMTLNNGTTYEGNFIDGFFNGDIYEDAPNKKPDSLKSFPMINQINEDCWAHSVSRNFVRTFQI